MPSIIHADCIESMARMAPDTVDLVAGSPPYPEKGERYIGGRKKWTTAEWVQWMLQVTAQAVRASRGYVLWVVNGAVRDGRYLPACEGLVWEWYKLGGVCERSLIWHKNAPPNRKDWFGNDWEFVLAFKKPGSKPTFNWQAVATAPKYTNGGDFRQRGTNGKRRMGSAYPKGKLARPRDVLRFTVGGGHLGSKLAHENEAPFPESLVRHLILACTKPGDTVLDPFCGSGTTLAAAEKEGRLGIGIDYRESQVDLTKRRLKEVKA